MESTGDWDRDRIGDTCRDGARTKVTLRVGGGPLFIADNCTVRTGSGEKRRAPKWLDIELESVSAAGGKYLEISTVRVLPDPTERSGWSRCRSWL